MKISRTIKFTKGKRRARLSDEIAIKSFFFYCYLRRKKAHCTIFPNEKSSYTVTSVGTDRDEKDMLKLGGSMTFKNIFKKQKETLVAFRRVYYTNPDSWFDAYELCRYDRPKHSNGTGFVISNRVVASYNSSASVEIPVPHPFVVGPWAGGDFILNNDFELKILLQSR